MSEETLAEMVGRHIIDFVERYSQQISDVRANGLLDNLTRTENEEKELDFKIFTMLYYQSAELISKAIQPDPMITSFVYAMQGRYSPRGDIQQGLQMDPNALLPKKAPDYLMKIVR
ncbi:MAG: hypothetical protein ABIG89_06655 [Candidatus Woesearchaeota archaeon]